MMGGGVSVASGASFNMTGGTISGNTVTGTPVYGGGVYVVGGTFNLTHGTVYDAPDPLQNTAPSGAAICNGGGVCSVSLSGGNYANDTVTVP